MTDSSVTARDIMREICTVSNGATFGEALRSMLDQKTNTVFVVNDEGELVGEVSVVNLLKGIVPEYVSTDSIAAHYVSQDAFSKSIIEAKDKKVTEFMFTDIQPVRADASLMQAAVVAMGRGQARIPVVDENNKPLGVISRRGLKCIIASHLDLSCDLD